MADKSNSVTSDNAETLKPRSEAEKVETQPKSSKVTHTPLNDTQRRLRLMAYHPSHKAVFIGLGAVVIILGINAAVLGFLLKKENANSKAIDSRGVSISPATLSKLGVNDSQIGSGNEKLVVDPQAQFNSQVTVGGDVSIGGQLHLNSTLNASNANLAQLQSGNTTTNVLNVNGSATASTLSVRSNLSVGGAATFQNAVTIGQLLSVDSSAAVAGNLSVGGELSAATLAGGSLVVSGPIEVGHIITAGRTPSVAVGGSTVVGSNATATISGTDDAGTIFVSVGAGPSSGGTVVHVTFTSGYSGTPVVVISPVNNYGDFYVGGTTTGGFYVYTASTLSPGSYDINYIVEQ